MPTAPLSKPPTRRPDLANAEAGDLASEFKDITLHALVLARSAAAGDDPALHQRAASAALRAGRPAIAVRLAARAAEIAGVEQERNVATVMQRAAEIAVRAAPRASARAAEDFVRALVATVADVIQNGGPEAGDILALLLATPTRFVNGPRAGEEIRAIDIINAALGQIGNAGIDVVGRGSQVVGARRIPLIMGRDSVAALLAQVEAEGDPCEGCGAPRWTFAHDDDLGEFCASCGWPQAPAALESTKRRKTNRELRARVAELEATVADRDATIATRDKQIAAANGRVDLATRTANRLDRARRAVRFTRPEPGMLTLPSPAGLTIEQLLEEAQQAVALAQAGQVRAAEVAAEMTRRQLAEQGE